MGSKVQYHEVKINLELRDSRDCYWAGTTTDSGANWTTNLGAVTVPSLGACSLFIDYIYLDTDERRRFAQVSHEYLIEQLQFTGDESTSNTNNKVKLNFNHPCKEIVWVVQRDENVTDQSGSVAAASHALGKQWFNYTDKPDLTYSTSGVWTGSNATLVNTTDREAGAMAGVAAGGANNVFVPVSFEDGRNPVSTAKLQLNGHDRFSERDGRYFNLVQPYQHHENVPKAGINVYSFGLKPEEHQPSGTCNFSRIDNAVLQLNLTSAATVGNSTCKIRVYALSYNVLRIMSGMGGLKTGALLKLLDQGQKAMGQQWCWKIPFASICSLMSQMRHTLLFGETLRAFHTKVDCESFNWPRKMNSGKVIIERIGQSACLLPKNSQEFMVGRQRLNRYGCGKPSLSTLKLQSILLGKLRSIRVLTATKHLGFIYSRYSNRHLLDIIFISCHKNDMLLSV